MAAISPVLMNPNEQLAAAELPLEAPIKRDDAVDRATHETRAAVQDEGGIMQLDPIDLGGFDGGDIGNY